LHLPAFEFLDASDLFYVFVANALVAYACTTVLLTVPIALFMYPPTSVATGAAIGTVVLATLGRWLVRLVLVQLMALRGSRLPFPVGFMVLDAAMTFTLGVLFGLGAGALRACIGFAWGAVCCTQLGQPVLPARLALYDAGFNAYGAMIKARCAWALGEPEDVPPARACWWLEVQIRPPPTPAAAATAPPLATPPPKSAAGGSEAAGPHDSGGGGSAVMVNPLSSARRESADAAARGLSALASPASSGSSGRGFRASR